MGKKTRKIAIVKKNIVQSKSQQDENKKKR